MKHVERLWQLYRDLGTSLDLDETLSTLDRGLARLIEYDAISVHLADEGRMTCAYAAGHGFPALAAVEFTAAEFTTGAVPREVTEAGLAKALQAPLEWRDRLDGTLSLYRREPREFAETDRALLAALAWKLAASIGNCRKFQRAEAAQRRALFDRLDSEVARIRRSHGRLAVIECAVSGLNGGWHLRERIAAELRRACREYDFIASSGDSFIVVLADFAPGALGQATARIERVLEGAGLKARMGAALFPVDGYDAEDLLAAAHGAAHA